MAGNDNYQATTVRTRNDGDVVVGIDSIKNLVQVVNTVAVSGDVNATVSGGIDVNNTVAVSGNVIISGVLGSIPVSIAGESGPIPVTVGNDETTAIFVTMAGSANTVSIDNTVAVSGSVSIDAPVDVNVLGTVAVSGDVNATVSGGIDVNNTVAVSGTVSVDIASGQIIGLDSGINHVGSVNVDNTVAISGSVIIDGANGSIPTTITGVAGSLPVTVGNDDTTPIFVTIAGSANHVQVENTVAVSGSVALVPGQSVSVDGIVAVSGTLDIGDQIATKIAFTNSSPILYPVAAASGLIDHNDNAVFNTSLLSIPGGANAIGLARFDAMCVTYTRWELSMIANGTKTLLSVFFTNPESANKQYVALLDLGEYQMDVANITPGNDYYFQLQAFNIGTDDEVEAYASFTVAIV